MKSRILWTFAALVTLLVFFFALGLTLGSVQVSLTEAVQILTGRIREGMHYHIIMNIRLPRVLGAILLGGALALSGYLLQTFFGNPIVGPFVLGISSGAKFTVALTMIFLLSKGHSIGSAGLILSAFVGAMAVMAFVIIISVHVKSMSILVVCGIMVGYICSAVTDLMVTFADDANIVNLHNWSLGSLSGIGMDDVGIMAFLVLACFLFSLCLSKPIGAYRLGEAYAAGMGVNVLMLRVLLILISGLLAACVTAFAGPISFVGIAVPHLMRGAARTSSPWVMIPASFLGGAWITLLCDGIARTVFAPTEVSISSVTAVLLVPVVICMMIRRRRLSHAE